jgi:hypothetical protein
MMMMMMLIIIIIIIIIQSENRKGGCGKSDRIRNKGKERKKGK